MFFMGFVLLFSSLSAMDEAIKREQIEQKIGRTIDVILLHSEVPKDAEIQSIAEESCVVIPSVGALTTLLSYNTPEDISGEALELIETFKSKFMDYVVHILSPK